MDTDQLSPFDAVAHDRNPTRMTVAEAEKKLDAIYEMSHCPTCAIRWVGSAECTCGKIDRLIELEDRISPTGKAGPESLAVD